MPSYTWKCKECEVTVDIIRRMSQVSEQPTKEEAKCECNSEFVKIMYAPQLDITEGAAFGGKFNNRAWGRYVEKANLMSERANTREDKREDIDKAIKQLDNEG